MARKKPFAFNMLRRAVLTVSTAGQLACAFLQLRN